MNISERTIDAMAATMGSLHEGSTLQEYAQAALEAFAEHADAGDLDELQRAWGDYSRVPTP